MPEEEERKISPALLLIPVGLGLAAVVGIAALAWAAPPEEPEPGLANLYGKVTDSQTGAALPDVLAALNGLEVYTDASGNYIFEDLNPGEYALEFSKENYETAVY
ncbi:hypothetical protein ES708_10228 [subsurface metagenome]